MPIFVEKIVNVLSTIFYTISNVVFPYYNKNANKIFARKLLIYTTVIGVLLYFIVGCSLKSFILLFFNNDMLMAIPVYWMLGTLFISTFKLFSWNCYINKSQSCKRCYCQYVL